MAKLAKNDGTGATNHSRSDLASDGKPSTATGCSLARAADHETTPVPISRHELIAIVLITLVGIGLRVAFPSRMAVEHFDEGVYASNIFFDAKQGYRFPNQHLYAPPLLPWLIEMVFILFGPSNVGAMVPSLVAGCLTVPLLWWVGRRWFGPTAGLAASILCATNDIHILFSRSALTDVLLCFWLLLAVYLFWEAITRDHLGWAITAGVATSLAWWTKYTGWLPLAITSAGLALSWLLDRRTRAGWKRHVTCWFITAGVAALLWLPWLWSLQSHGGYKAVHVNHRGYVVGWGGWWKSLCIQARNILYFEQALTCVGWAIAVSAALFCIQKSYDYRFTCNDKTSKPNPRSQKTAFLGAGVVLLAWQTTGTVVLLLFVMLIDLCRMVFKRIPAACLRASAATAMVSVWLVGLCLFTPTYHPYPRLVLPILLVSKLGLASLLDRWLPYPLEHLAGLRKAQSHDEQAINRFPRLRTAVVYCFAYCWLSYLLFSIAVDSEFSQPLSILGWQPRFKLRDIVSEFVPDTHDAIEMDRHNLRSEVVFYVYGEPALYFQLRLAGVELVRPVEHLAFARAGEPAAPVPIFLVTGPHAELNPNFARQFAEVKERLKLVKEYEYQPSDLVWRDQRREFDKPPTFHVKLYRVE